MALREIIDRIPERQYRIVLANREHPEATWRMLEELYGDQSVTLEEVRLEDMNSDQLLLFEDGELVARSPLDSLGEAVLFTNSDAYTTGTYDLEDIDVPEVMIRMEDAVFEVRGYPASNSEKLLFIALSRYIESRALRSGTGHLRSSFQKISRIRDEQGTASTYRRLGKSSVDVHVYGVPDWIPPAEFGVVVHGGYDEEFRYFWFVVYEGPPDSTDLALLFEQTGDVEWRGFFSRDQTIVNDVAAYIKRAL